MSCDLRSCVHSWRQSAWIDFYVKIAYHVHQFQIFGYTNPRNVTRQAQAHLEINFFIGICNDKNTLSNMT